MDSTVTIFELQNDFSVKQCEVPPTFPRVSKSRLYIVTNQRTQLHLLNNAGARPRTEDGGNRHEKRIFQYGVSTKVLSVTDPTGAAWEVRLLLSPSEISRLSSHYNLTGFVSSCQTTGKYRASLSSLCAKQDDVQELCMAAGQFLSCSEENQVSDYCENLKLTLTEKLGASCSGQQNITDMVVGALVALVAAELATSVNGTRSFDYEAGKEKTEGDQTPQILELIKVFDVMAELLTVTHQGKKVQIIFRNPCPDNWASGGKKLVGSGETFVFGLCHKVVSISEAESEIQFLQNLQESYDLVSVFHLPAFVEHLLMTTSWRNKIGIFLKEKDQRKEITKEMSSLAVKFFCSEACHQEAFLKEFQSEMLEKLSNAEAFLVGDEVVCAFGILVAILAAVAAKSIVDGPIPNDDDEKVIMQTIVDEGRQPDLLNSPGDVGRVKSGGQSSDVDIGGAESKIGSTNDPDTTDQGSTNDSDTTDQGSTNDRDTTDQGSTNGSPKTTEPLAEPLGVCTLDIADQEIGNDNPKENFQSHPGARDKGSFKSTMGSTKVPGTTDQGSTNDSDTTDQDSTNDPDITDQGSTNDPDITDQGSTNDTDTTDQGGTNDLDTTDQGSTNDTDTTDQGGTNDLDITDQGSTNDPDTTDQGSINGSPKTAEPLAEPLGVSTLDIADQEIGNDNPKENFQSHPGARDKGSFKSTMGSSKVPGTTVQCSTNDSDTSDQGSTNDPDITDKGSTNDLDTSDQGSTNSSPKTAEPLADPLSVSTLDITRQEIGNDYTDEYFRKDPGARSCTEGRSPTIPELKGLHSQSSSGGPNRDDSNDGGASRVAPPISVGARDNALETQDLSSTNTIFSTSFIVLIFLLVVAIMLTVLPQSLSSVLVASIVGLLVVKWFASQHP